MKYFLFQPIYQERVWGGTWLASEFGRELPEGKVIGESWEMVDRPEAQSTTRDGKTIRELIAADPEGIMGSGWPADKPFPILVKWLDCQEKLSLQVHPPADIAPELGGEPKTENWYIAKAPTSRDELKSRLLKEFGEGITAIEFGSANPEKVAILTGSGRSALDEMKAMGADTLNTGELRQEHFNLAQEEGFNLYVCGHYATERYGVTALANLIANKFDIPLSFVQTGCPL